MIIGLLIAALIVSVAAAVLFYAKWQAIDKRTISVTSEYCFVKTARTEKGLWDKKFQNMNGYEFPPSDNFYMSKVITVGRFE
jgi:predicted membrane-bound dolichyl-phosphate-mannose-protein mannosyltransferase